MFSAQKILKSSFWQYLASWLDKLIGFISTIILARLLVPDDFGVVSAAAIVTGLFHVISVVGTGKYLIRKTDFVESDYHTGWTINVIMRSISAASIFLLAPLIAQFMGDERLIPVLQVTSITPLLYGFYNIGMVLYERDYNFKPRFIIGFSSRLIGFGIKIGLALYIKNYWAFIIAEMIEALVLVCGSYVAHPFRPRFSLKQWRHQWAFSQWILLKSIFVFLQGRIDNLFITKYLALEQLGTYNVAKELATLPAGQIIEPIMQPLYVGLSSIHENTALFADKTHKSLCALFIIILPISFGTYVTANNLVDVLLGSKWQNAIPVVIIFAFILIPGTLGSFINHVMTAKGKVKIIFKLELLFGMITVGTFTCLATHLNMTEFAFIRVCVISINTLIALVILTRVPNLSFFRIIGLLLLPLLTSIAMVVFINELNQYIIHLNSLYQLIIQVFSGACFYIILSSCFIYLLRNSVNEYQFIWKTFYLGIFSKKFVASQSS